MWSRFMDRVLAEANVKERFTEHDVRAKAGSDAESLEKARKLLQHAHTATTNRIYRRKAERVEKEKAGRRVRKLADPMTHNPAL